ncbi:FecR family protein [Synechococcus sp. CS-1328]|nr:FecR family protein [Synechococcus sp. CS-1328]
MDLFQHRTARQLLCLGLLGLGLAAPAARAATETATVVEILDGKELFIQARPAKVNERARSPETVSTRNSRGQLRFDTGAVGRMNRFSQVRLGSRCFLLSQGQILVSGPQSGCTQSARMSVRGTNYVLNVAEDGQAELSVLEGSVAVEPLRTGESTDTDPTSTDPKATDPKAKDPTATESSGVEPTIVEAGQKVKLSPQGVILTLLRLSAGDYNAIFAGPLFKGFTLPLPAMGSLESYIRGSVPGVTLPSVPVVPSVPSLPRFGIPGLF